MWRVGDTCKLIYAADNLPYLARIEAINGASVTVRYVEYDGEENVTLKDLMEVTSWNVGDRCKALYSDGIHYNATIMKMDSNETVAVIFDGYANEEIVYITELLPIPPGALQFLVSPNDAKL